jgi:EmrB/QacA subfamily drug resistance transporter
MMQHAYPKTSRFDPRWLPLAVTTVGSFMSILDTNIINIALPTILKDFKADLGIGQLVITAYVMALAVVIPMSGFLGERVGMKRLYMFTLAAFTAGSALCALSWNVESLIFFRVLQGLGGGMLQPLGMAIVFTMITPLERPKFVAMLGIPSLMAPLIGPSVGGYIVEYASWRMIFLMNVPVGLIDIYLAHKLLKETPIKAETKLDSRGLALATIAFPALLLGLSQGTERGWSDPSAVTLFVIGFIALGLFIRTELRHHDPMLRLDMFKIPMFRLALFTQWIGNFSLFGLNILVPLYLQRVQGLDAAGTGRVMLPMGFVAFVTMNVAGKYYNRLGPRPIVMTGLAVLGLTTLAWSRVPPNSSFWLLTFLASCRGLGMGMFGQTLQVVTFNSVPEGQIPRATSLVNMCQRVDTAFSTAILTSVLIIGLPLTGAPAGTSIAEGDAPIANMRETFDYAFILMTAISVVGILLANFLRDHALEEFLANEKGPGRVVTSTAASALASEPQEGGGSG